MSGAKALQYAENTLGVHAVYEEATAAHAELDKVISDLDTAHDRKRLVQGAIESRSLTLLNEQWAKHPDMSAARMTDRMKQVRHGDEALQALLRQEQDIAAEIQGLDYDADMLRLTIKIRCARMNELGGYLNYLASVKQAETLKKQTTPATPSGDTTP